MSDFLDRAVSRGLGIARVVHRQSEPFAETTPERYVDRDGIVEIAERREDAHARPVPRTPSISELPERRAAGELRPEETAERTPVAADGRPVLEVVASVPIAAVLAPNGELPFSEAPHARGDDETSEENATSALLRRDAAAFSIDSERVPDGKRFGRAIGNERVEDPQVEFDGQVRYDVRQPAGRESSSAARLNNADAHAKLSADAYRSRERLQRDAPISATQADERTQGDAKDSSFAMRRRGDEATFDAAPDFWNGATETKRAEDELTINVSIGSIEVARPQPPPVAVPAPPGALRPSLDDYLQLRERIRGR